MRTLREAAKGMKIAAQPDQIRLVQGAGGADTSLMTMSYPAEIPWPTAPCTMRLSVFHLIACLPPPFPVRMSNKLFHISKLYLWGFFSSLCA